MADHVDEIVANYRRKKAAEESLAKRGTLELIQDEFHRLAVTYPPLYHERFYSPLEVSREGWDAFAVAQADPSGKWEKWYCAHTGNWLGRFYGAPDGMDEIERLSESLSVILPELGYRWPLEGWVQVLHEMAENCPSPLLRVERNIWNWEPDEHIGDDCAVEDAEPYLHDWVDAPSSGAQYPRHPLHRVLAFNLFTCSIAAIRTILAPKSMVLFEGYRYGDLPVVLSDEEPEVVEQSKPQVDVKAKAEEQKLILSDDKDYFPFLFRKTGSGWIVRFRVGDKIEADSLPDLKGCQHYQNLLLAVGNPITCLTLDPPKEPVELEGRSIISQDEAYLCPCQLAVADFLSAGRAGWRGYGLRRVGGGPGAFSAAV